MQPKASAICCTCGRPHVLGDAIASFLAQDYPNKELIIINDLPDYPVELLEDYENVKVFNYQERFSSLGAKRNEAFSKSSGEFIFLWEDDDLSTPWRMSSSIELLEDSEYDLVKCSTAIFSQDNSNYSISGNNFEGSTCYTREFLDNNSFDELRNVTMDLELEKSARVLIKDFAPNYIYIYRWGLGIWHLSGRGSDDSQDNWNQGLVHAKCSQEKIVATDLTSIWKDTLELIPEEGKEFWKRACKL